MEDALKDVIIEEKEQEGRIFNLYVDKTEIADKIYDKIRNTVNKDKRFYLSDNNTHVGIVSVADGLKSLATLSAMNLDIKKADGYLELMRENLKELFDQIEYPRYKELKEHPAEGEPACLRFNLTPFDKTIKDPYVDTASKLLSSIIEIREVLFRLTNNQKDKNLIKIEGVGNVDDILLALNDVVKETLRFLCLSAIPNPEPTERTFSKVNEDGTEEKETIAISHLGWNFTRFRDDALLEGEKDRLEASLYFTYSVAQAYMSVFDSAQEAIYALRADNVEQRRKEISQDKVNKFDHDVKFMESIDEEFNELRNILRGVGLRVDAYIANIDLRDLFLGVDGKPIDHSEIERSTTNNALFNTLFAVSILNNCGVFDIYDKYMPELRKLEYASSVINNVFDMYMDLEINKKLYIVEQYVLNFNEFIPANYFETANYLRKQRIQVVTIIPLLVKTYSLISAWIVKYPQKQMMDYLKLILESRRFDKRRNVKEWIWDKEMYDVSINSIFVSTLADFYEYYEKYEQPFLDPQARIAKTNADADDLVKKAREDAQQEIQSVREEADQRITEANKAVERAREERENLPIIIAIKDLVREVLDQELVKYLPNALNQARDYIFSNNDFRIADQTSRGDADQLAKAVATLISAYAYHAIIGGINTDAGNAKKDLENFERTNYEGLGDYLAYRKVIDKLIEQINKNITNRFNED